MLFRFFELTDAVGRTMNLEGKPKPGERLRCPLRDCVEFHEIVMDKNSKPYVTCKAWGTTVWFDRGGYGRSWWTKYMPTAVKCPGCGRPAEPEDQPICPDCGEPWDQCPGCFRILSGEDHCEGCGFRWDEETPTSRK